MAKILIVDDDSALVESMKLLLEGHEYKALVATNGKAGFEKAIKEKPDAILLDVMMTHDKEGFEVSRQLRGNDSTKDIPIILVTGIRKVNNLPFSYEPDPDWLPVNAVLDKPVKPENLLKAIDTVLAPGAKAS